MPGVYPAMGPIMRPNGDDEPRTQDADLDAHHRAGGHELQPSWLRGPESTTLTAIRRSH
jgi:hypothetical protein